MHENKSEVEDMEDILMSSSTCARAGAHAPAHTFGTMPKISSISSTLFLISIT